jgi:hypothetical protein
MSHFVFLFSFMILFFYRVEMQKRIMLLVVRRQKAANSDNRNNGRLNHHHHQQQPPSPPLLKIRASSPQLPIPPLLRVPDKKTRAKQWLFHPLLLPSNKDRTNNHKDYKKHHHQQHNWLWIHLITRHFARMILLFRR